MLPGSNYSSLQLETQKSHLNLYKLKQQNAYEQHIQENSEADHGFVFFTVSDYQNTSPAILEFNLTGIGVSVGIAKTSQTNYATITNFNNGILVLLNYSTCKSVLCVVD